MDAVKRESKPLKIGTSKGCYYLVIESKGSDGKPFALPVYGPYDTRPEAEAALTKHG